MFDISERTTSGVAKTGVVAVVGNPNVGKTTLFNALTGMSQVTGNYPGVTVERKAGTMRLNGTSAQLVDLPGTYSLAARSPDEMIVADVLLGQQAGEQTVDAVLAVVDATNLERNLYLLSQIKELGKPVVVALNMMDLAAQRHIRIDVEALSKALGAPVVPVCAHKRTGVDTLKQAVVDAIRKASTVSVQGPEYPESLVKEVEALHAELNEQRERLGRTVPQIEAFRILIDRNGYAEKRVTDRAPSAFKAKLDELRSKVTAKGSLAAIEARSRYAWIRAITGATVRKPTTRITTFSDKLDYILTHKIYGTIVFAVLMATVFQAIFSWAAPLMDAIDAARAALGNWVGSALPEGALQSLIVNGVIKGAGSVLVFIPQILILSLFVAILEDCGYMARAAFLMDRLLSRCGLSGQSFIPLLSSFACAIPGIMATRTIANRRDRFATILVAPLMSCSARLPVYTLMIGAFIPATRLFGGVVGTQGLTMFAMYCIGIAVAVPVAWFLKRTMLRGETPPFLLELPSYKWPQWGTVLRKVYSQGKEFVIRAGTIIFAISVVVWALAYFPHSSSIAKQFDTQRDKITHSTIAEGDRKAALAKLDAEESGAYLQSSYFGRMGHAIEPAVRPLGWDWRIGMASIASFPAREVVIATMGTIFFLGGDVDENSDSLRSVLKSSRKEDGSKLFSIPVALSLMVFFALCCQCGATLAIIRRETRSYRWPIFAFTYMTVLAYVASFIVYQSTMWLGWGSV